MLIGFMTVFLTACVIWLGAAVFAEALNRIDQIAGGRK